MSSGYIYLIESYSEYETLYKIGYTRHSDVKKRLKSLKTGNPNKLTILSKFPTEYGRKVETALHHLYSHKRLEGEWFALDNYEVMNFMNTCSRIEENYNLLNKIQNSIN